MNNQGTTCVAAVGGLHRARGILFLGLLLLLGGGALLALRPATAAPGAYHEDAKFGYKIKTPREWRHIAMGADEKWISTKYLSDKAYRWMDKETGSSAEFKPVMQVIVFIDDVVKKRGVETEEDEEGTLWISLNNPYKNYEDFLKRTYSGGGWYVSAEEEGELKGVKVTKYEIKVEKLTYTGPKRIVSWVFHTDDVDYAVQFEVLENSYKKLKSDMYACLKSFKLIKREGSMTDVTTGKSVRLKDESELSQDDRTAQRKQTESAAHNKARNALPDDWSVEEMGRFLVLNHADKKYAKKTVAHAEAIWDWLDKNFAYIGTDEYVRRPILRICADADEENAFRSGTSWGDSLEIVTHEDKGSGAMSWELEYVNNRIYEIWFNHRNGDLYSAMPYWLKSGLKQVLGTARAKGSKLEFKVDDWEREGLRESAKKEELTPPRELVTLSRDKFYENRNRQKQSAAFIRFLLEGKSKKTRKVLEDYLRNLQEVVKETQEQEKKDRAANKGTVPDRPETEEEEEAAFKKRREGFEAKESEFLQAVFDRTFGDWSDKDWARIEKLFFKSIG